METKNKAFDAVAESRKWREVTGSNLDAMSVDGRWDYLGSVRQEYRARPVCLTFPAQLPTSSPGEFG